MQCKVCQCNATSPSHPFCQRWIFRLKRCITVVTMIVHTMWLLNLKTSSALFCNSSCKTVLMLCRKVKFTGEGILACEAAYRTHGSALSIQINGPGHSFWYLKRIRNSWVADPCEWDSLYAKGVKQIERDMAETGETWDLQWVTEKVCRWVFWVACAMFANIYIEVSYEYLMREDRKLFKQPPGNWSALWLVQMWS